MPCPGLYVSIRPQKRFPSLQLDAIQWHCPYVWKAHKSFLLYTQYCKKVSKLIVSEDASTFPTRFCRIIFGLVYANQQLLGWAYGEFCLTIRYFCGPLSNLFHPLFLSISEETFQREIMCGLLNAADADSLLWNIERTVSRKGRTTGRLVGWEDGICPYSLPY